MKNINIIGSGFSGMTAAALLAKEGQEVHIFEKNSSPGGRAAVWNSDGFTFDMGPSWYWMPEIFNRYFSHFDKTDSDFYDLVRLDPAYRIFFGRNDYIDISAKTEEIYELFDKYEENGATKLKRFLADAEKKYEIGVKNLVYQPAHNFTEFITPQVLGNLFNLSVFKSYDSHMRSYFKNPRLHPILQFPIIFLGAMPKNTPALYSLMNYADLKLGTWYPMGGMGKVSEAFYQVAKDQGVQFHFNQEINHIDVQNNQIAGIQHNGSSQNSDFVIGSGDYYHIEQKLLDKANRQYDDEYWDSRVMAPSSLLFFLGIDKKLPNLLHHNLLFDEDFEKHADQIFTDPQWPAKPLLYVSATSKTDDSVAPEGMENLVVLIPVAAGLEDKESTREYYYNIIMERLEKVCQTSVRKHVIVKKSYAHRDFEKDYNAYKGNAYGLGNTLMQTAFLKPKMKSKKVKNLFYCGQLTTPGPGVPPAIISGEVVANEILKTIKH